MEKDNYLVYIHTNKVNGKRYVGVTSQRPERRWQNGLRYTGTLFKNDIDEYGWDGFFHEVVAIGLTRVDAFRMEKELIERHRANNPKYGYNVSHGGRDGDTLVPKYGVCHPNHQRVRMIDPSTGQALRVFGAQAEAARELGISRKGITKACMGVGCATYKGYIWEYVDKDYLKPGNPGIGNYEHAKIRKPVRIISVAGDEKLFDSVAAACKAMGVPKNSAWRYLKKGYPDKLGRRWCYA